MTRVLCIEQIEGLTKMMETNIRVMKSEHTRLQHEQKTMNALIKENLEKVKMNKQLPYLVANCLEVCGFEVFFIIQILDIDPDGDDEDGGAVELSSQKKGKCVVVKTSTRQTIFLPVIGLVEPEELTPGDLIGVNKDSYLILEKLPAEYDSRVKAMEVDEKPTEDYSMVGGLDKQIEELIEAVVLPITHKERFKSLGIKPPKGIKVINNYFIRQVYSCLALQELAKLYLQELALPKLKPHF